MARIYIAGRMNGMVDRNFPMFNQTAARLRKLGHEVLNPVEVGDKHFANNDATTTQQQYLEKDILELLSCDSICLLPGWEDGIGAVIEAAIAKGMGFDFYKTDGEKMIPPFEIRVWRSYPKNFINSDSADV